MRTGPSQKTPGRGRSTARNISGIAADAIRHSTHKSSPGEDLEVAGKHLDRTDVQRRGAPGGAVQVFEARGKSKWALMVRRKWSSPHGGRWYGLTSGKTMRSRRLMTSSAN